MAALPISGVTVALRSSDGSDDLLLAEAQGPAVEAGIALLERLSGSLDVAGLVITDFEFLLLQCRAQRLGGAMALGFTCPHCRAVAEVSFRVADCCAAADPKVPAGVTADPERPGWFRLGEAGFRLPAARDVARAGDAVDPARALLFACCDELARSRVWRAKVERAMAAMAPTLSGDIDARCPGCDATVSAGFSVADVVVAELKRLASGVHDEVDLIARAYHWPEPAILALPQLRRRAYADRIRRSLRQAA